MADLFNDSRASTIKEPLIGQNFDGDPDSKDVESGEPTGELLNFSADLTAKPQEPGVELFADSVKYSRGTNDAASMNGMVLNYCSG